MSRCIVMSLVLFLGLGIGCLVPAATNWWYDKNDKAFAIEEINSADTLLKDSPKPVYHFKLNQGVLSVVEGKLGTDGKVIIDGLDVQTWPKVMLEMAPTVEFYSLDEVQSFIDTVNEPLWQE